MSTQAVGALIQNAPTIARAGRTYREGVHLGISAAGYGAEWLFSKIGLGDFGKKVNRGFGAMAESSKWMGEMTAMIANPFVGEEDKIELRNPLDAKPKAATAEDLKRGWNEGVMGNPNMDNAYHEAGVVTMYNEASSKKKGYFDNFMRPLNPKDPMEDVLHTSPNYFATNKYSGWW